MSRKLPENPRRALARSQSCLQKAERFSVIGNLRIRSDSQVENEKHRVVNVRRVAHFDSKHRDLQTLPKSWQDELKKKFGLPPNLMEGVMLEGYDSPIPKVLEEMKQYLISHGGLEIKGIFRLAPDAKESNEAKAQINAGTFQECKDVNVISNLIKVWFRDLPRSLLASANTNAVQICRTEQDIKNILASIEEPYHSITLWLLDLCGLVSQNSSVNLMGFKNMAIVMAPNLYQAPEVRPGMDPMEAMNVMKLCKKFTEFVEKAIAYRLKHADSNTGSTSEKTASIERSASALG